MAISRLLRQLLSSTAPGDIPTKVIGVCGMSCSGKSTVSSVLRAHAADAATKLGDEEMHVRRFALLSIASDGEDVLHSFGVTGEGPLEKDFPGVLFECTGEEIDADDDAKAALLQWYREKLDAACRGAVSNADFEKEVQSLCFCNSAFYEMSTDLKARYIEEGVNGAIKLYPGC